MIEGKVQRTRGAGFLVLLGCFCLCWGCASTQETATIQYNVNALSDRVSRLENRLQGMEAQDQRSADLYARLEELEVRVGRLNGKVEELQRQLYQMGSGYSSATPPAASSSYSPSAPSQPAPGASAPQPKISIQPPQDPAKALYNSALQLYQQGKFEQSRQKAQVFLAKYPKSDLADNALFLIGEGYYSEKRYKDAIESYQQIMDRYPKGNKVPSALLKQANAFQKLGDATAARILYERLIENYPKSPQAQIAEKELKRLP